LVTGAVPVPVHESVYLPTEIFLQFVREIEVPVTGIEMFPVDDWSVQEETSEAVMVSPHLPEVSATTSGAKMKVAVGSGDAGVHDCETVVHPDEVQV
jgi:hypothetical protein